MSELRDNAANLFVRFQLLSEPVRSVLIFPMEASTAASRLATALASYATEVGRASRLVWIGPDPTGQAPADGTLDLADVGSRERVRQMMDMSELTIVVGRRLLASPETLLVASAVDAVVAVVEQGTTTRANLERARRELAAVGARLVAAVLT